MIHVLYRVAIAAIGYVAFIWIVPLFLAVMQLSMAGNLWALLRALAALGAIAYVIWGAQRWPWGPPA